MYDNYYILSTHFQQVNCLSKDKGIVGGKAVGLFLLDKDTLPFAVITTSLYKEWINNSVNAKNILQEIINQTLISQFKLLNVSNYIIRSSAIVETSRERGNYVSSQGNISNENLLDTIINIWLENKDLCKEIENNSFAVIIQQYILPIRVGHISNERRISREINLWHIEQYRRDGQFLGSKRIKYNDNNEKFNNWNCSTEKELNNTLKQLPTYLYQKNQKEKRVHIEWIWDKKRLWIVQCDYDEVIEMPPPPGAEWQMPKNNLSIDFDFSIIKKLSDLKDCKWSKVKCVQTFIELGLPFGEVYILDDAKNLEKLSSGKISKELESDLKKLLEYPIVIRMDIVAKSDYERILLPRTDTVLTLDDAKQYLIEKSKYYMDAHVVSDDFCFLIHRFILSQSCALALAKPNKPMARIDSTWGIVDGLYYHPHDSFEISLSNKKIKKLIRCKSEYIDIHSNGQWFSKKSGKDYDWKESLTKKLIIEIADYTTKIANHLDKSITVMYFVGIDERTGYGKILPWFYIDDEVTENSERFADSIFSNNYILIETKEDMGNIADKIQDRRHKYTIKLRPNADIIRDKDIVEEIADFAIKNNIPVEMAGSILAHPYYILKKKGVRVRCINKFEPQYSSQTFDKLVRDKIAINIEQKGEKTRTIKVDSKELLQFLKKKAIEEALEFFWENDNDAIIEELADIYEVIRSSCNIFGKSIEDVKAIADNKLKSKGGFESGIVLVDTTEESLISTIEPNLFDNSPIRRTKKFTQRSKIHFSNRTLQIPYIDKDKLLLKIQEVSDILDFQSIEIIYTSKNIAMRFIKKEPYIDKAQLKIEFPEDK
ncbi:hypothetical protein EZS27_008161 [termite gut metagenome]|uniref:Uncharacterized protein n=1 Tax=termite gut metagenome TaxID=433724 RepID=A0A5J4SFW5_9ZZZZ